MKIKKILGASAIAALATLGLASCGGEDTSHIIDFYTTAGDDLMIPLNEAKANFEKANAGWTVRITNGFGYDTLKTKLTSAIPANQQPSLAFCYPDHVSSYLKTGKVVNLKPLIDDAEIGFTKDDYDDIYPAYLVEGGNYGVDGIYSVPMVRSTEVLYYNKTIFDEMNLTAPTTWDEMWKVCQALKAKYPKSTPLGYDSDSNFVISYLEQYGKENSGKFYTDGSKEGAARVLFNNDVTKAFLKDTKANFDKGYFTTKTIYNGYTSALFLKYNDFAASKKANDGKVTDANYAGSFMSIGSTGGASKQASDSFDVGYSNIPGISADNRLTISQGPSMVMFDQGNEEKITMTWKFTKYLMSEEVQAQYCQGGYSPIRKSVYENEAFKEIMDDGSLAGKITLFTQELAQENLFFTSDAFNGSAQARTCIATCFNDLMKTKGATNQDIADLLQTAYDDTTYYAKKN